MDYMELRLWIGIHSCIQCFLLVATDASYIIKYMTRFTEEGFSSLISFIFISDAIKKMAGSFSYYAINTDFEPDFITSYKCECVAPDMSESFVGAGFKLVQADSETHKLSLLTFSLKLLDILEVKSSFGSPFPSCHFHC